MGPTTKVNVDLSVVVGYMNKEDEFSSHLG
jgi:hypothetical protein